MPFIYCVYGFVMTQTCDRYLEQQHSNVLLDTGTMAWETSTWNSRTNNAWYGSRHSMKYSLLINYGVVAHSNDVLLLPVVERHALYYLLRSTDRNTLMRSPAANRSRTLGREQALTVCTFVTQQK